MQAYYPNGSPYRDMRHAFATIYQGGVQSAMAAGTPSLAGGIRALYRGVWPTTVRGIVLSATQICSYDQIKQSLKRRGIMQEGVPLHFVASTFAGLVVLKHASSDKGVLIWWRADSSVQSHLIQLVGELIMMRMVVT